MNQHDLDDLSLTLLPIL